MSTLTPNIEIDIQPTHDLRVLKIEDISDWKHLAGERSYINITTPGRKNPVTNYFQKGKVNIFNSNNLDLSTSTTTKALPELPDGIYHIKVFACEGCKFFKELYYLRTVRTMLDLDMKLMSMDLCSCNADENTLNKYLMAELLLESAHANTRDGQINQAMCEYEKAKELLKELEGCGK